MKYSSRLIAGLAFASAFQALALSASGQPAPAILAYDAAFFAGAQAATAFDMVQRLPGFVFDGGDTSTRGFAGAAGNVLIDGTRPTAKTDNLSAILRRIPARQVARIDIIRGGAPGIDMQGLSVVANVVLVHGATQTTVIATIQNTLYGDGHSAPGGSVQIGVQGDDSSYNLTLTRAAEIGDDSAGQGFYTLTTPGVGMTRGYVKRDGADNLGWTVNGDATLPLWGGRFGANTTFRQRTFNSRLFYGAPQTSNYFQGNKRKSFELGLHWDGTLGDSDLNLLGLQRLEQFDLFNTGLDSGGDQRFTLGRDTGESIMRGTLRWHWTPSLTLETGLEGAYNTLKGLSSYVANGVVVPLPAADSRVAERRGEAFVQASWKIDSDLSLEATTRAEFSRISARGAASRGLSFLKPRLLLTWSPQDYGQLRLRAEKTVGQLDFANFVATSDLSGNGVSAGNLALKPDQRWQFEATYEYHFWNVGAAVLSVRHDEIKDLVDFVPIGAGIDGPGNIAHAANTEYKIDLSVPLERLGIDGATLKSAMKWDISDVRDPVTEQSRVISGQRSHAIQFDWLQDLPAWKSSFDFSLDAGAWVEPNYRIDQISRVWLYSPYVQITWSYKPEPTLELNAELDNFLPYHLAIAQENYAGPRNTAPLAEILDVRTSSQPRLYLQLRKTF